MGVSGARAATSICDTCLPPRGLQDDDDFDEEEEEAPKKKSRK